MAPRKLSAIGEGDQGDARFVAELARFRRRLDGDLRYFLRRWRRVDGRIGDEDGASPRHQHREPEHRMPFRRRQDAGDLVEGRVIIAGQAGDHRLDIAEGDHAGGKDVAVLVDHALAVPEQGALALHAIVQEVCVARGFGADA